MGVVILGSGRISRALEGALKVSSEDTFSISTRSEDSSVQKLLSFSPHQTSALILAAPLDLDHRAVEVVSDRFSAPILSVASHLTLDQLRTVLPDRPVARFFCSAAVRGGEKLASLRLVDEESDSEAIEVLMNLLPSPNWRTVGSDQFDRRAQLFVAAALVAGLTAMVEDRLGRLDSSERRFLAETIREGERLLVAHDFDSAEAFDSALTPGGMTESLFREIFDADSRELVDRLRKQRSEEMP